MQSAQSADLREAPFARRLFVGLAVWNAVLLASYFAFHLTWRGRGAHEALAAIFLVTSEQSLVTWTTVTTMFSLGVSCLGLGFAKRRLGWKLSGCFFVYLSMDDGAMLHERLGWILRNGDSDFYNWVIVVMPVVALLGLLSFRQVWRDAASLRGARAGAFLAFAMWAGALVMEIGEKLLIASPVRWRGFAAHKYSVMVEEGLELMAPAILLTLVVALLETSVRESGIPVAFDVEASSNRRADGAAVTAHATPPRRAA